MKEASWKWMSLPNRIVPDSQRDKMMAVLCRSKMKLKRQGASGFPLVLSIDSISGGGRVIFSKHLGQQGSFPNLY